MPLREAADIVEDAGLRGGGLQGEQDEAEGEQAGKAEKAPLTATPRPGWTTLTQTQTQTPQTQDESMMVDELRSSSPAHSSLRAAEPAHTPRTPASAAMPPPSTQKRGRPRSKVGSQPEAQAQANAALEEHIGECYPGDKVLCVQMHGDASFTGQGIVMEGLGLSEWLAGLLKGSWS